MTCKLSIFALFFVILLGGSGVSAEIPNVANRVPTATFIVDRADDVGGGGCTSGNQNDCSLRSAIELANSTAAFDVILFDNDYTIELSSISPLPPLSNPVSINGGNNTIRIDGNGFDNIFVITANNVSVQNLYLYNTNTTTGAIIEVAGSAANTNISLNTIGDFEDGTTCVSFGSPYTGGFDGVAVADGTSGTHIFSNFIRCLNGSAAFLLGDDAAVGLNTSDAAAGNTLERAGDGVTNFGDDNRIAHNVIRFNNDDGLSIEGDNNVIYNNSIVDNTNEGLEIRNGAIGTQVYGNDIGRNGGNGILVSSASLSTTIGCGISAAADDGVRRNILHANGGNGIDITGNGTGLTVVKCNHIGSRNGVDRGNALHGIRIDVGAASNAIGNANGGFNLIVNSGGAGIYIQDSDNNTVQGNKIGVNSAGTQDKGNGDSGIVVDNSDDSTIGGTTAAVRNVISGNTLHGIHVRNGSTDNTIQGNYIGTSQSGNSAIGNSLNGIQLTDSDLNIIGSDSDAGGRNVISGNLAHGIVLNNSDSNDVWGNYIGVGADGSADVGNSFSGMYISQGAANNEIGFTTDISRNVINHNDQYGIHFINAGTNNHLRRNFIGRNDMRQATEHSTEAPTANTLDGIHLNNTNGTKIGTATNCALTNEFCLRIVSNGRHGIYMLNADNTEIGAGTVAHFNGHDGIRVVDTSQNNTIMPNRVTANGREGIVVKDTAINNEVRPNLIQDNGGLAIDLGDDGFDGNDPDDSDSGPNLRLNHPVVTNASNLSSVQGFVCNFCRVDIYTAVGTPNAGGGGGIYVDDVFADASGNWSANLSTLGFTDINDATFTAVDTSGNTSEMSPRGGSALPTAVTLRTNETGLRANLIAPIIIMLAVITGVFVVARRTSQE